ncbi:MAG: TAXI family TRAP transporter solute-binding subunit [Rhodobacteraceae bacterium]|nr:TAXI family TRAP transporter solute-binding subunit [Paracoccaceae bacterium]
MGFGKTLMALAVGVTLGAPAAAQPLGIGTMGQGTAGYGMGSAIAGILAANGVNAIVQPSAGTSAYLPLIGFGELDFGIANAIEVFEATNGVGAFDGRQLEVRVAARLFPFRVGVFVRADSDIHEVSDLRGKRVTYGFTSQVTLRRVMDALLASGEVGGDEIVPVMVPNVVRGADDFAAGQADAAFFAMGAGKVAEVDASVGGIRFLPIPEGAEAEARMQAIVPQAYVGMVSPAPNIAGVSEEMTVMAYDYILVAGAHVPDETVEQVVRLLHENKDALAASFAGFRAFDPDRMYVDIDAPYHPGSLAAFRALGQID